MKKFIALLVFISLLFIIGACNKYITKNVYERSYATEELATTDVYRQLYSHGLDSIPLDKWIYTNLTTDSTQIIERICIKYVNDKSMYQFIYMDMCSVKEHKYNLLIRYSGKKKDLK